LPGTHNLHNAAAAFLVGDELGIERETILDGLQKFRGTARRFETVGTARGITIIDDYAHHPTEVAATLESAHLIAESRRVLVVFQPHLFTRTQAFYDDFGASLARADEVIVLDVYPAREDPIPGVTGELVADAITAHGGVAHYVPNLDDVLDRLISLVRPDDVVLTVGAGSVTAISRQLLHRLER
jgi:UDP-N-acetylmuramate--alanine ligase